MISQLSKDMIFRFSLFISISISLRTSNPKGNHRSPESKVKKDWMKNNRENVAASFSPLQVNGGFLLPWKPEF